MFLSIATTVALITVIGCVISFTVTPSTYGWSMSFVISILVLTILPTVKYANTLTLDHSDHLMLTVATLAHAAFFVLLSRYVEEMDDIQRYLMWSACALYPTCLLLLIGLWTWRTNRYRLNKLVIMAFTVSLLVGMALIAVAWWLWGTRVGAFMLALLLLTIAFSHMLTSLTPCLRSTHRSTLLHHLLGHIRCHLRKPPSRTQHTRTYVCIQRHDTQC